jgi:molybdate transport system regulatory protein
MTKGRMTVTDVNDVTHERQVADLPEAQRLMDAIHDAMMAYKRFLAERRLIWKEAVTDDQEEGKEGSLDDPLEPKKLIAEVNFECVCEIRLVGERARPRLRRRAGRRRGQAKPKPLSWARRASCVHGGARIDLETGGRIGPGKIALLEAIRKTGSITAAARSINMSYRRAWLLVDELNKLLNEPAVTGTAGGVDGGGSTLTPVGQKTIQLCHSIEMRTRAATRSEFQAFRKLMRD